MGIDLLCRVATTFDISGAFDEELERQYLQRFIDTKLGVFMGSGGSGEGHTLTKEELTRVYRCGVAACKGRIPVWANPPEQYSAKLTIEHTLLAAEAGCEVVNVYGLAGLHAMKPTEYELQCYFDEVLSAVKHPVALAAQPLVGYQIRPELIAALCNRYTQVVAVNLTGVNDAYFMRVKDGLKREVDTYVPIGSAPYTLKLGATGLLGTESNVIPKTYRDFLDAWDAQDFDALAAAYNDIQHFLMFVSRWNPGPTRWIKMAMRILKLPGGEGGPREPYRLPPEDEMRAFEKGLLALGLTEIEEQARAAGLMAAA